MAVEVVHCDAYELPVSVTKTKLRVALCLLQWNVDTSHLPHFSFLDMNNGDGTKCSEEGDSTDDTLAYDDDK